MGQFPKSVRLPDGVTSVDIRRHGLSWVITPAGQSWAEWFDGEGVSDDFMPDRGQPGEQVRFGL